MNDGRKYIDDDMSKLAKTLDNLADNFLETGNEFMSDKLRIMARNVDSINFDIESQFELDDCKNGKC